MHGILPQLRAATAGAHRALEADVQIERRVSEPTDYAALLAGFFGFYASLEPALAEVPWEAGGSAFAYRDRLQKTGWLRADLLALGRTSDDIAKLPRCASLPRLERSLSRGFGCVYVLEGATLGGRQILRLLAEGDRIPADAQNFFRSYGSPSVVGERWQEFTGTLEDFAAQPAARDEEIVEAANETFASLHAWLQSGGAAVTLP